MRIGLYYKDFNEKMNYFELKIVNTIDKLKSYLLEFNKQGYIYRGAKSSKYKIFSTLDRCCIENEINVDLQKTIQLLTEQLKCIFNNDKLIRRFIEITKSNSYLYEKILRDFLPLNTTSGNLILYLLSTAQHYEGISPFIDFSKNIFNALFFTYYRLKDYSYRNDNYINNYVSLYIIKKENLGKIDINVTAREYEARMQNKEVINQLNDIEYIEKAMDMFKNKCLINPDISFIDYENILYNENIKAQDGVFIFKSPIIGNNDPLEHKYLKSPTDENLKHRYGEPIIALEINKKLIPEVKDFNKSQNSIDEESMFPLSDIIFSIKNYKEKIRQLTASVAH